MEIWKHTTSLDIFLACLHLLISRITCDYEIIDTARMEIWNYTKSLNIFLTCYLLFISNITCDHVYDESLPDGIISKCTTPYKKFISFTCPKDTVITDFRIAFGTSGNQSCVIRRDRCLGLSPELIIERNECYWRNTCKISLKYSSPIVYAITDNKDCIGAVPSFISLGNPTCTHKENVYDICQYNFNPIRSNQGIIRSHKRYPWNYRGTGQICRLVFRNEPNSILMIRLFDFDISSNDILRVSSSNRYRCSIRRRRAFCFQMERGSLELTWIPSRSKKTRRGFKMIFDVRRPHVPNEDKAQGLKNIPIFEEHVSATVQEMITKKKQDSYHFSCPENQVIYSPTLETGISDRRKYRTQNWNCSGIEQGLLEMKNKCYWKQKCIIKWNSRVELTSPQHNNCIREVPNIIATKGFKCINEARIHDVCDNFSTREGLYAFGIIRSHPSYPWNRVRRTNCRKLFKVGLNKHVILVIKDIDVNMSKSGYVNLEIWHRVRGHRVKSYSNIAANSTLTFHGGTVEIVFKAPRSTRKGFLIFYSRFNTRNDRSTRLGTG